MILKDKAKYFGPYSNVSAVNDTIDIIRNIYPIRTCNIDMDKAIKSGMRPCLNYHIKMYRALYRYGFKKNIWI